MTTRFSFEDGIARIAARLTAPIRSGSAIDPRAGSRHRRARIVKLLIAAGSSERTPNGSGPPTVFGPSTCASWRRSRPPRARQVRIAFYAPLKTPDHPTASGDRLIAGLFARALEQAGHEVVIASRLRSFDGAGDRRRQLRLARAAKAEARRLRERWHGSSRAPECWFTYHLYHKAPDWIGPRVSAGLGIPYVVAEASHAPKQAGRRVAPRPSRGGGRALARRPTDRAQPGRRARAGTAVSDTGAPIVRLAPFLDTTCLQCRRAGARAAVPASRVSWVSTPRFRSSPAWR